VHYHEYFYAVINANKIVKLCSIYNYLFVLLSQKSYSFTLTNMGNKLDFLPQFWFIKLYME